MSLDIIPTGITLSPAYRQAQRTLAQWLERGTDSRQVHFIERTTWGLLDAVEHDRLARWLAWLSLAASSRGDTRLATRIQRLDAALDQAITHAMHLLPGQFPATRGRRLRLSA
ncbi:MAG TPA: hypothetical protein VF269_09170 [Rhodanobacteraceae bacterium]